eukprot:SAG11_NODE_12552_length_697_cov_1.376254_1_plen_99_part_00
MRLTTKIHISSVAWQALCEADASTWAETKLTKCDLCPRGTDSLLGSAACARCAQGWYAYGPDDDCRDCASIAVNPLDDEVRLASHSLSSGDAPYLLHK